MTILTIFRIGFNLGAFIVLAAVVFAFVMGAQHAGEAKDRHAALNLWLCAVITALLCYGPLYTALSLMGLLQ